MSYGDRSREAGTPNGESRLEHSQVNGRSTKMPTYESTTEPTAEKVDTRLCWFPAEVGCSPQMVD
jgi:hypothetical protein